MPTEPKTVSARAKLPVRVQKQLALDLAPIHHVHKVRRGVSLTGVAFVAVVACSIGVPAAYAQVTGVTDVPVAQSMVVSASVPIAAVLRDGYTAVAPTLVWPVDPNSPIASPFGARTAPCDGCSSFHEGVDFDAGYGAQVHAIADGVVVETDNPSYSSLGVHVAIQHVINGVTIVSAYGHMQTGSMTLKVGDTVKAGQVIGLVGSTGASTGPHLHFEIRMNGTDPINPLPWMHAQLG